MPDYQGEFSELEIRIAQDYNAWFDYWLIEQLRTHRPNGETDQ